MSTLWVQAMAWRQEADDPVRHTPVRVTDAGFKGYVGDSEYEDGLREDEGPGEDEFDEDLYDRSSPEPTPEEHAHYEEHGEHPDSYYERHDNAYAKALEDRKAEDRPDIEDPELGHFIREHGGSSHLWQNKGHLGTIPLGDRPVYATQSHVSKEHVQRYLDNPQSQTAHEMQYGPTPGHLANEAPQFVTHEGRLHAIEGHHRIAAALQRRVGSIHGWHFNLDKHPEYGRLLEDEDDD